LHTFINFFILYFIGMGERIESEGLFSTYRLFAGIPKMYDFIVNGPFKNRDKLETERQLAFVSVKSAGNDDDAKHLTQLLQTSPDFEKYQPLIGHFFEDGELKHDFYNKVAFIGAVDRVEEPFVNSKSMTYLKNSKNYIKLFGKNKDTVLLNSSIRPYYNTRKNALYFGKGTATKLLSHILREMDTNGVELTVLQAMSFPLTDYYKGFGFIPLYNIRYEIFDGFYADFGIKEANEVNKNIPVVNPGSNTGRAGPLMFRLRPKNKNVSHTENVRNINPFSQQNKNRAEAFFQEPINGGFKKYRGIRKNMRKSRKSKKSHVKA
jgi:hypothetical protein